MNRVARQHGSGLDDPGSFLHILEQLYFRLQVVNFAAPGQAQRADMEFRKILTLGGPNIWARWPVLEAWIELGELKDSPSDSLPGFNDRLMSWLPQMIEHRCSVGERGGFFQRLRDGTYPAHILEHVTLELQARAGADFGFGRARESSQEGLFRVAVRYEDEALGRACLETGRRLCLAAIHNTPFDVAAEIHQLRLLADDVRMGPSTRAVADAARARGIPVRRLSEGSLVQLGHGSKQRRMHRSATDRTGAVAEAISDDKSLTKEYLRSAGVPVAAGRLVTSAADAWQAAQEIGTPVVVKPKDANFGSGVVIGISQREQIEVAYEYAAPRGTGVMVERLASGAEHRLLVVGGKFTAATRGNPAWVTGDGKQSIAELIESQLNSDPRRGTDYSCPLAIVELDPTVLLTLQNEGFTPESVPNAGKQVLIQRNGNLAIDCTDDVHSSVQRHAETAARVIGLDVAGIDIIAQDIGRPLEGQGGVIIEVNASPGLQMHLEPESGKPRPVGEAIVDTLFAPGEDGRIPLVAVSGTQHTLAVSKLIRELLTQRGDCVALATAEGSFVGETKVRGGDARTAEAAATALFNPTVDAAVFEMSIESILTEGLGFDLCRVAVLTAMGEGPRLDFAEWDTPHKKSLVYRATSDMVLKSGAVVLPAGEPLGSLIIEHCPAPAILVSGNPDHDDIRRQREAGGRAVVVRGGQVTLISGSDETALGPLAKGSAAEVVLPAVATLWALGAPSDWLSKVISKVHAS